VTDAGDRFKQRLNELLDSRKLKQVDLACHLRVTKTTVSRYCAGRIPDAATLERMAQFFNVSVDDLLGRTEDPNGESSERSDHVEVVADPATRELIYFLRGRHLTQSDVEAVVDLLEARRLRREREEREKSQP